MLRGAGFVLSECVGNEDEPTARPAGADSLPGHWLGDQKTALCIWL